MIATMTIILMGIVICIVIVIFILLVIVICVGIVIATSDHPTTPRTSLSPGLLIAGEAETQPCLSTHDTSRTAVLGKGLYKESMLSQLWSPPQKAPPFPLPPSPAP